MKSKLKRSDLLTSTEVSALLRVCKRLHQRAFIEFLLESGCRAGEALALTVRDIEHEDHFIVVSVYGKTGARTIPLLKDNLPVFLLYTSEIENGRIFPWTHNAINRQFRRIYANAGVDRPNRPLHIFRHMKCCYLIERQVPETIVKKFMGWSSNSNMIEVYTHIDVRSLKDFFTRLYGLTIDPLEELYPQKEKERIKQILG